MLAVAMGSLPRVVCKKGRASSTSRLSISIVMHMMISTLIVRVYGDGDECASNPCAVGRTCVDQFNAYYCRPTIIGLWTGNGTAVDSICQNTATFAGGVTYAQGPDSNSQAFNLAGAQTV